MDIEFAGAAREVTGSCHILRINGKTILLDCGMFQGRRSETRAKKMEAGHTGQDQTLHEPITCARAIKQQNGH